MAQGMKRLGMPIAALLGVALIGLIGTSWFLNRDALREAVEAQIRAVTGLDLVVSGAIDVSVFPGSYVSFHDVGLKGGGTTDPALQVDVLTANLRLLPLLLRRFEIADVMMLRPHIRVVREAGGESNWTPFVETIARTMKPGRREPGVVLGNQDPGRRAQLRGRHQPRLRTARRYRSLAGVAVDLALVRRDRTVRLARRARRRLDQRQRFRRDAVGRPFRPEGAAGSARR